MRNDDMSGPEVPAKIDFPALVFDPEAYRDLIGDCELTEAEQREFLEALWAIMVAFVDMGFRIHPAQEAVRLSAAGRKTLEADSQVVLASDNTNPDNHSDKVAARLNGRVAQKEDS
jgi:hypothetical protein